MPFSQLGLHPDLARALKAMNFEKPMPIQEAAIPLGLSGRDVLGCAQTGSGKTAAFALPVIHNLLKETRPGIRALVLVPTRELAAQVEKTFRDCGKFTGLKTAVVIGGVGFQPQVHSAARAQILIATPGRLLDHLRRGSFRLDRVEQLVLDEADRMLDMGFLPDIKDVIGHLPRERQTQLFSATLAPEIERIAAFALREPVRVEIEKPSNVAEGISQILYPVVQSQKSGLLLALLKSTEIKSALIFTRTKHGADKLAKRLAAEGHAVGVLHGNRSQNQRTTAMEGFRQGRLRLMVATDIAARGIDVQGISHVINFDVPRTPEDYVHRVGRTARAYGVGDAVTLMDPHLEGGPVRDIERFTGLVFPRAVLPDFQYNSPPREPFSSRPPDRRPGQGQGRRDAPRHGDRSRPQGQGRPHGDRNRNSSQGQPHGNQRRDGHPGNQRTDRPAHPHQGSGQPKSGNRPPSPRREGRPAEPRRDDFRPPEKRAPAPTPFYNHRDRDPNKGNRPRGYF